MNPLSIFEYQHPEYCPLCQTAYIHEIIARACYKVCWLDNKKEMFFNWVRKWWGNDKTNKH